MATHQVRIRVPEHLTGPDCNIFLRDIKSFLETCRLTDEAKAFLRFNSAFSEVLEKL